MKSNFLVFLLLVIGCSAGSQNTVIKAGHLFDSKTGKMLANQLIIIKEGSLSEVGSNLSYNSTEQLIDLSNSWVLQGLMDCHVHIPANEKYRHLAMNETYAT